MHWLTDPYAYGFFKMGLRAGILGGALCGFVGVYVVLRRMSYIGHGLSHAVFGGAAVSYVVSAAFATGVSTAAGGAAASSVGWSYYLGAGAAGLLSALLINAVARRRKIGADAAIGVVTMAAFALGVALITGTHIGVNLDALLFGNILGVTWTQLWVLIGVSVFAAGVQSTRSFGVQCNSRQSFSRCSSLTKRVPPFKRLLAVERINPFFVINVRSFLIPRSLNTSLRLNLSIVSLAEIKGINLQ